MEYLKSIYFKTCNGCFQRKYFGRISVAMCLFLLVLLITSKNIVFTGYQKGIQLSTEAFLRQPSVRAITKLATTSTTTEVSLLPMEELKVSINSTNNLYPVTVNASYLMENSTLCSSAANLSVLIVVHTSPDHLLRRQNIRATFANNSYYSELGSSRVLFLLGRVHDRNIQTFLVKEFEAYGDMLQGNFVDAYHNLTHKGVMGYKWISERCRNAKFILKVDDDITVNMYQLFKRILPEFAGKKKQIVCNHIYPETMPILRDKKSKWYVNERHFRGKWGYPRYCSGFIVIFTNDFIRSLYKAASLTPFFWVDDVYLYGLLPSHVPGVQYNDLFPKRASYVLNGDQAINCYKNVTRTCGYFVTGAAGKGEMNEAWFYMGKEFRESQLSVR